MTGLQAKKRGLSTERVSFRGAVLAAALIGSGMAWVACGSGPPKEPEDLCSIFREKRHWHRSAERSYEKWGVPPAIQLAIIHQESSFRSNARPPREQILWIFPGPRPSSAYGYGQVIDETWDDYRRSVDRSDASRRNFADVADFIGWYGDRIHRRTGIDKEDATELYAAYHEGPGGYLRGNHLSKAWLGRVSVRVGRRASRYQRQYDACREELKRPRFWGLF